MLCLQMYVYEPSRYMTLPLPLLQQLRRTPMMTVTTPFLCSTSPVDLPFWDVLLRRGALTVKPRLTTSSTENIAD
jgi:hypothetical protein